MDYVQLQPTGAVQNAGVPSFKGRETATQQNPIQTKKDGDKKIRNALIALGTIAVAGVAIANRKKIASFVGGVFNNGAKKGGIASTKKPVRNKVNPSPEDSPIAKKIKTMSAPEAQRRLADSSAKIDDLNRQIGQNDRKLKEIDYELGKLKIALGNAKNDYALITNGSNRQTDMSKELQQKINSLQKQIEGKNKVVQELSENVSTLTSKRDTLAQLSRDLTAYKPEVGQEVRNLRIQRGLKRARNRAGKSASQAAQHSEMAQLAAEHTASGKAAKAVVESAQESYSSAVDSCVGKSPKRRARVFNNTLSQAHETTTRSLRAKAVSLREQLKKDPTNINLLKELADLVGPENLNRLVDNKEITLQEKEALQKFLAQANNIVRI